MVPTAEAAAKQQLNDLVSLALLPSAASAKTAESLLDSANCCQHLDHGASSAMDWLMATRRLASSLVEVDFGERIGKEQPQPFSEAFALFLRHRELHVGDDGDGFENGRDDGDGFENVKVNGGDRREMPAEEEKEEVREARELAEFAQWDAEKEEMARELMARCLVQMESAREALQALGVQRRSGNDADEVMSRVVLKVIKLPKARESNFKDLFQVILLERVQKMKQAPPRCVVSVFKESALEWPAAFASGVCCPFLSWALGECDEEQDLSVFQLNLIKESLQHAKRKHPDIIGHILQEVFGTQESENYSLMGSVLPLFQFFVNEKPTLNADAMTKFLNSILLYATQLKMGDSSQSSQSQSNDPLSANSLEDCNKLSMLIFTLLNKMTLDKNLHLPLLAQALQDLRGRMSSRALQKLRALQSGA